MTDRTNPPATAPTPDRDRARRPGPSRHAVYVISVAAELCGTHPQTLRIYERRGLVAPKRTQGGTRRYSDADLARLRRITELTSAGVNLAGVERILALEADPAAATAELDQLRTPPPT